MDVGTVEQKIIEWEFDGEDDNKRATVHVKKNAHNNFQCTIMASDGN